MNSDPTIGVIILGVDYLTHVGIDIRNKVWLWIKGVNLDIDKSH